MNTGSPNLWDRALGVLENEIGGENFSLWLSPTKFHSLEGSTLTIAVPDALFRNWLASHYMGRIAEAVEKVASQPLDISFVVRNDSDATDQGPAPLSQDAERLQCQSARLARQYSFDNFVVGESNRFACAASQAVADPAAKG